MKKFNWLALPGSDGCPEKNALCCFWLKQDQFFLGFINPVGDVQAYTSDRCIPKELIKAYHYIFNETGALINITIQSVPKIILGKF